MEVLPLPTDADVIIISMRHTLYDGDEEFGIHHEEQFSLRIPGLRGTELLAGFPGQEFNVALDTSSSMTWVPSIHAPPEYRRMHMYKRYVDKLSRTYSTNKKHFDVIDNSGRVTGYFSQDSFTIAGLKIKNQSFGEALLEPDLFWRTKNDGILGLGVQLSSGDSIFSKSGYQAVVDSSSSFVAGPFEETRVINQQLGGKSFIGHHGLYNYKFDCSEVDNLPDVEFIVNGQKLSLSGRDYTARVGGEKLEGNKMFGTVHLQ
ncbi:lysosomal aspartic protease [Plakobranchus ocellatus]|uniref:Lysosomal aspartic protease n=1 Tax=Plakobranchus ocellatus TaxID=259542 RepID=A0AAV4BE99_9GAST|nr:lysosomal aspartic protease [Plakobranchus ocellatus]